MKNQYFGDVNDYRKYGLLRALSPAVDGKLLVAWMMTPDDRTSDGGRRGYLQEAVRWEPYDRELYTSLRELLLTGERRVSLIERSQLLPGAEYYSDTVPDGLRAREVWHHGLLAAAARAELVFVDPDNGIEVPSLRKGQRGSSKYVSWDEIEGLWRAGCSVLIYQHFPREPRRAFSGRLVARLRQQTGAPYIEALATPHVLFLLAGQEKHATRLREAVSALVRRWAPEIRPADTAEQPPGLADG